MLKNKKLIQSIIIIFIFISGVIFLNFRLTELQNHNQDNQKSPEGKKEGNVVSPCLKLLEEINSTFITNESKWEVVEISAISEEPVSINNLGAKRFQETARNNKDIQANYGPFIMERREKEGGEFIQETNSELKKCAQDKLIISIWQP